MTFGLTPQGFIAKRLADIKQDLENALIAQFGEINIDAQSVFGQQIGVQAKQYADLWENLEDVYFSQYPNSAEGVALDNVVAYNGLVRLPAQQTRVTIIASGNESTLVPQGSLARIPNTNNVFFSTTDTLISSANAYSVTVAVTAVAAQIYTMVINSQAFSYSLPIITFTGDFVAGNSIVVTLNGVNLAPVPFTTNTSITNGLISARIASSPAVFAVGTPTDHSITIIPNFGFNVVINSIVNAGSGAFPTYAISYGVPPNAGSITSHLASVITAGAQPVTATDLTGTFTITADNVSTPFSAAAQDGLVITAQSSPVSFLSQDYGPVVAPANSVTEIITPIGGLTSITNPTAGVTGRLIETDSELRLRFRNSSQLVGNGTVEAIRAHLLQDVPGVTSALVFENSTMYQAEIDIVFSGPLVSGNSIVVTINTRTLGTITYATSNAATMNQLAILLAAQPEIATATVGGANNNTLQLNMNIFQLVTINDVTVTGGASQATATIKGGRTPKSFEAVVSGGSDADIAEEIWLSKPAGIATFGNTSFTIIDSMGNSQLIFFSRPINIYIWATVALTLYTEETFPLNGAQLVQQAILAYGNSLGVGVDVLLQRVLCQIFTVPGVASGIMTLAATNSPNDAPTYASADIAIAENEISIWDINRITVTI